MSKRKRETANEESATPEQRKKVKNQKTNTPKDTETEGSAQAFPDRGSEKLARKLAKRERKAPEKQQRDETERKDGIKGDGDTGYVQGQEQTLLENGRTAASRNRHEGPEREKDGGQKLRREQKSKKEKRKDRAVRTKGKKSKEKAVEKATWKVSDAFGGQMLDVDPVFSLDEK